MTTQVSGLAVIKERQQEAWSSGDYAAVGATNLVVGELLCEAVDLHPGQQVLDVATGSGNAALAAARRYCEATGVDHAPALLERARERAAAEGLWVTFREGDAEDLPFPDASFDVVLSTIGAMFAPDQEKAASELLRVCRPGGRIGMANWTPDGLVGELFRAIGEHVPPPPDLCSPLLWGTEERLRELFGEEAASLRVRRRSFVFRCPSPRYCAGFVQTYYAYYGPVVKAFETLDKARQECLMREVEGVVRHFNRSGDETMVAPSDYLEVVAIKRRTSATCPPRGRGSDPEVPDGDLSSETRSEIRGTT